MNARVRKHGLKVRQDNGDRTWKVKVQREGDDGDARSVVYIYAEDDSYYHLEFASRSRLNDFMKQLQQLADEVWPQ